MYKRVVLVGFMAAGKSSVGRALARLLDWAFIDLDEAVEQRAGRPAGAVLRDRGEPAFRSIEAELTAQLEAMRDVVIAPGAGWITIPGVLDRVRRDALVVWLDVSVEEAVRRAERGPPRPLLEDGGMESARRLYAERASLYAAADVRIAVDCRGEDEITREIAALVRRGGDD